MWQVIITWWKYVFEIIKIWPQVYLLYDPWHDVTSCPQVVPTILSRVSKKCLNDDYLYYSTHFNQEKYLKYEVNLFVQQHVQL